jgi:hypothetical protein
MNAENQIDENGGEHNQGQRPDQKVPKYHSKGNGAIAEECPELPNGVNPDEGHRKEAHHLHPTK